MKYLEELYLNKSGPLTEVPFLMLYFSTKNNEDKQWPNIKMNVVANPFQPVFDFVFIEIQKVRSKGTIRLQSASPYIPPKITTNFLSNPRDFEDAVDATKYMFYLIQLKSIQSIAPLPNHTFESVGCRSCPGVKDYQCKSGIECYVRHSTYTSWHSGGSCRMGAVNRSDVVVDPYLRVKNIRNLRVCDASIFPDLPNANTNAAAHMVGEKCADIINRAYTI